MFRDKPDEWHTLPATKEGLMVIPPTKEACGRHMPITVPPPPEPIFSSTELKKKQRKKKAYKSSAC